MSDRTARAIAAARAIGTDGVHDGLVVTSLPARDAAWATVAHRLVERHPLLDGLTRVATAGLTTHAARRLIAIDREVVAAVEDGVRQVVVLGAGFDTRAWRLAELRAATVYELDLPPLQARKRERMSGRPPLATVRFVPADLAHHRLEAVLEAAGHQADAPTAWLWEAVTMYLPTAAVQDTLAAVGARSAAGSRLIATYLEPDLIGGGPLERWVRPVVRASFAVAREPLRTTLTEAQMRSELARAGFDTARVDDLREAARDRIPTARRDLFAAERLAVGVMTSPR